MKFHFFGDLACFFAGLLLRDLFFLLGDFLFFLGDFLCGFFGDTDSARVVTADSLAIELTPPWHAEHFPVTLRKLGLFLMRLALCMRMVVKRLQALQYAFTMFVSLRGSLRPFLYIL